MRILGESAVLNFETRVVEHLRSFLPERFTALGGEPGVRSFVKKSLDEAAVLGCCTERQTARYVQLAFLLGDDFSRSLSYPWIPKILSEPRVTLDEKLQRVFERLFE